MKKIFVAVVALIIMTTTTAFAIALFDTPYIGNANTMRFHHRNCRSVNEMNPDNQRPLNSREEAINAGYVPCKRCKP
ncbi:MAG: hypothetical protein IJS69_06880 [Selenomonadaceae bacterium]|nr:hypothetical protein [Selenomonadaceae bacterium]